MDRNARKGIYPFLIGFVLLLMLLSISCSHTQQETIEALSYSPSFQELETMPLSIPETAHGYGREYELLGVETFSTIMRAPTPGFLLQEAGLFPSDPEDYWIVGRSQGERVYRQYYSTDLEAIQFKANGLYEVQFTYKVLETPDEGFEVIFYSDTGASRNDWVGDSIFITEPEGSQGEASFTARLKNYPDYILLMNIVRKGSIAVRDIVITDLETGKVVAEEHGDAVRHGHSLFLRREGNFSIKPSTIVEGGSSIFTKGYSRVWTNPEVMTIPKDSVILLEFDYKVNKNVNNREHLGWVRLFLESNTATDRGMLNVPAYDVQEGHYAGAVKTGSSDGPYIIELGIHDDVEMEFTNIKLSKQIPVQPASEIPALQAVYPRLGDFFTAYGEWVASDGSGSAQGDTPWMSLFELEKKLAYNDVLLALHEITSTNDPAFALRMRTQNPSILLLPSVTTHTFWEGDEYMQEQMTNELANAEISFIRGIDPDWILTTAKGKRINITDGVDTLLLNISPFCPPNSSGQTYLDYWKETMFDLHIEDGTWDGVYLQQLLDRGNDLIKGISYKTKVDADYNVNQKKDETPPWIHEMTVASSLTMLRSLREKAGMNTLLIPGHLIDPILAPFCNGMTIRNFNWGWYHNDGEKEWFGEAQWSHLVNHVWELEDMLLDPAIILLEATPLEFTDGKREPLESDYPLNRFALGTALLTDSFYEYDLVDGRSAPFYFDELLVTPQGRSTDDISGKGWLGKALSDAEQLTSNEEVVLSNSEPILLGNRRTKYVELFKQKTKETESRQYTIELDWKILETSTPNPTLNISLDNNWIDYYPLSSVLQGSSGHLIFHTTVPAKQIMSCMLNIGKKGVVEVSNVKISKSDSGLYRRDFEHGIVIVNATNEDKTVSLRDIKGPLNRTNLRHIKGRLDTVTNNGQMVNGDVTIKAHDALILLAD